jgi:hypothetical protein
MYICVRGECTFHNLCKHEYACTHVCILVCLYVYVCVDVCMHVCMHACMYVKHIYVGRLRVRAHICVCMYICMYVCMHACMHVCMYACTCVNKRLCGDAPYMHTYYIYVLHITVRLSQETAHSTYTNDSATQGCSVACIWRRRAPCIIMTNKCAEMPHSYIYTTYTCMHSTHTGLKISQETAHSTYTN